MNRQKLVELIKNPKEMSFRELKELEDLVKQHPYFQLAHALIAKVRNDRNFPQKEKSLNHAAIHAPNRNRLKKLFYDELPPVSEEYSSGSHPSGNTASAPKESKEEEKATNPEDQISSPPPSPAPEEELKTHGAPDKEPEETTGSPAYSGTEDREKSTAEENAYQGTPSQSQQEKSIEERKRDSEDVYKELEENLAALRKFRNQYSSKENTQSKSDKNEENKDEDEDEGDKKKMINPDDSLDKVRKSLEDQEVQSKSALKNNSATYLQQYGPEEYELPVNYFNSSYVNSEILDNRQKQQNQLIDRFIQTKSNIYIQDSQAIKEEQKDLSEPSTSIKDNLVSENLAEIMVKQGKYEKAIDIFKKLIWKFPQKKDYFASKIQEIKNK